MFYLTEISLIFYFISLSNAVNLKIDGMIDLGPNWSYEYRIVGPADNVEGQPKHAIARHGRHHLPELNFEEKEQERKDEEKRKEKEEVKHREKGEKQKEEERHKEAERTKEEKRKDRRHHKEAKREKSKRKPETTAETKPKKTTTKKIETFVSPHQAQVTFSSQSEHSSLEDSTETTVKAAGTMFDIYDFTTTKRPKNPPPKEVKKSKVIEEPMMEVLNDDFTQHQNKPIQREYPAVAPKNKTSRFKIKGNNTVEAPTTPSVNTTTEVTTLRTGEIFSDPHKIKDDAKINDFTNHIYKQTLKVFDSIKQKTNQYHLKREVDALAKSYEEKFREFLAETRHQKIKTRLGTQKVVLNTIDMSNRILKRLINFMIGDMDKKGVLRNNLATANIFQKEVDKEQSLELTHACKKFGICRAGSGFPEFLTDMIAIMLKMDDRKFQHTFDSLTEALKNADYSHSLPPRTGTKLKEKIEEVEKIHIGMLRPMFMILKNIITHKNRPLVVTTIAGGSRVNSTLAFLEIVDVLDQNLPQNEANLLEWNDLKNSLTEFSDGKRFDVQEIMETFVKHLKKAVKSMDAESQKIVAKNLNIILE